MTRRHKIEALIAIIILIIFVILLLLFLKRDGKILQGGGDEGEEEQIQYEISEVPSDTVESGPDIIARSFVERFGSFSTEAEYENIQDIYALVTPALQSQLEDLREDALRSNESYYGVSTRIISISESALLDTAATYVILTQRTESIGSVSNTSVRYQDLIVSLVKSGDRWLVDSYTWQ